jgi:hypothetical protein
MQNAFAPGIAAPSLHVAEVTVKASGAGEGASSASSSAAGAGIDVSVLGPQPVTVRGNARAMKLLNSEMRMRETVSGS